MEPARLLEMLRGSRTAQWSIVRLLAAFPEETEDAILDAAAELESAGSIETWPDAPGGVSVILSALEAFRLGIRLDGQCRKWVGRNHVERQDKIRTQVIRFAAERDLSYRCPASKAKALAYEPKPVVLLGERLAWQGPDWQTGEPCPSCRGRELPEGFYCLICDEAGPVPKPEKLKQRKPFDFARSRIKSRPARDVPVKVVPPRRVRVEQPSKGVVGGKEPSGTLAPALLGGLESRGPGLADLRAG